jgi:hypothetical protein
VASGLLLPFVRAVLGIRSQTVAAGSLSALPNRMGGRVRMTHAVLPGAIEEVVRS